MIRRLNQWANAHTNLGIDAWRFLFAGLLFYKGLFLGFNETESLKILESMPGLGGNLFLIHYITMAHLCGALFIAMGLLTRLSAIAQLPILIGALLVNFTGVMIPLSFAEALFAVVSCVFFLFYGSGKHSVDYNLKLHT